MNRLRDRRYRRYRRKQRGIAAAEFTIVLPLILFLMLATAELGFAFMNYNTLTRSTRDATRYLAGVAIGNNSGVVTLDAAAISQTRNVAVYGTTTGTGTPVLPGFSPGNVTVNATGNNDVTVISSYDYQPLIGVALPGLLGQGPINTAFTMQAQVTMKAIS